MADGMKPFLGGEGRLLKLEVRMVLICGCTGVCRSFEGFDGLLIWVWLAVPGMCSLCAQALKGHLYAYMRHLYGYRRRGLLHACYSSISVQ